MLNNKQGPSCSFFLFCDQDDILPKQIAALTRQDCAIADFFIFCPSIAQVGPGGFANITWINYLPQTLEKKLALAGLASGEFICLLDCDFIPPRKWIQNIIRAQKHYQACLVQNGQIYMENPGDFTINPVRDYWCDTGAGWLFFPAAWLCQITEHIKTRNNLSGLPLISLAGAENRKIELLSDASKPNADSCRQEFPCQTFQVLIPASHQQPLRALLSVKGQSYRNYQCQIQVPENQELRKFLKKMDPQEKNFRLVGSLDEIYVRSGDIFVRLSERQWLAHSDVLRQFNKNLSVPDAIQCPRVSCDREGACAIQVVSHFLSENAVTCAFSPDLAFVGTGKAIPSVGQPDSVLPFQINDNATQPGCALATVITPDHLPDALLSLASYDRNCAYACAKHIFVATGDPGLGSMIRNIFNDSFCHILLPEDCLFQKMLAKGMAKRYGLASNEYRWSMKSVVLSALLEAGHKAVLHLDPDIYAVSDISDIHTAILNHSLSVFPHFRDPDNESTRRFLYQDGFFNGGMLGATGNGLVHLHKLSERCLRNMQRDRVRNLFDDQKYYELFVLECDNLYVNMDRGINYSLWNSEPAEGLIGPSQRSFLLRSGDFVRIWHMHSDLVHSLGRPHVIHPGLRPVIIVYVLALIFVSLLVCIACPALAPVFEKRTRGFLHSLLPFLPAKSILAYERIFENAITGAPAEQLLPDLVALALESPSFDNFELYCRLLEGLFPASESLASLINTFHSHDFRYISDTGKQPSGMAISQALARHENITRQIHGWLEV